MYGCLEKSPCCHGSALCLIAEPEQSAVCSLSACSVPIGNLRRATMDHEQILGPKAYVISHIYNNLVLCLFLRQH